MTFFEVKDSATAMKIKNTYESTGYSVEINVNHAAFIDSKKRTDNLFIVSVSKK